MLYAQEERFTLYHGDNREVLKELADNSVDSIVTDPPYELGFMGKSWDASGIAFNVEVWQECLRVLKPGGHLLAFSGSRTYHRMAVAIEDAGFEIRDQIMWIYGSGFPKSLNIAKSIENKITTGSAAKNGFHKLEGERTGDGRIGMYDTVEAQGFRKVNPDQLGGFTLDATTPEAQQWDGWGTALKPAHEPIVVARKPLIGTVAANVLTYGTGGLNIDGSRVGNEEMMKTGSNGIVKSENRSMNGPNYEREVVGTAIGRWPANVIHDGSDEVVELFPETHSAGKKRQEPSGVENNYMGRGSNSGVRIGDPGGSAARFFYCAKASKRDRNEGLEGFEAIRIHDGREEGSIGGSNPRNRSNNYRQNHHQTVKPTNLMRYLCRLITPPNGTVLDPFMGSGSTGKAAVYEKFNFVGIELTDEYLPIAKARVEFAINDEDEKLL
jgi:site-specific DNA-methyltransferase (adenine-specific)